MTKHELNSLYDLLCSPCVNSRLLAFELAKGMGLNDTDFIMLIWCCKNKNGYIKLGINVLARDAWNHKLPHGRNVGFWFFPDRKIYTSFTPKDMIKYYTKHLKR